MTKNDFIIQAVLAQMNAHPILGAEYMSTTCTRLVKNATLLADTLVSAGVLRREPE